MNSCGHRQIEDGCIACATTVLHEVPEVKSETTMEMELLFYKRLSAVLQRILVDTRLCRCGHILKHHTAYEPDDSSDITEEQETWVFGFGKCINCDCNHANIPLPKYMMLKGEKVELLIDPNGQNIENGSPSKIFVRFMNDNRCAFVYWDNLREIKEIL